MSRLGDMKTETKAPTQVSNIDTFPESFE